MTILKLILNSHARKAPLIKWSRFTSTGCTQIKVESGRFYVKLLIVQQFSILGSRSGKPHEVED